MPASSIRARSSGWPLAVIATIGMRGRPAHALAPPDLARGPRPVEPGHHAVHEQEVERLRGEAIERLGPAGDRDHVHAVGDELAPRDPAVALAVVRHEHSAPRAASRPGPGFVVAVHAGSILQWRGMRLQSSAHRPFDRP